MVTDCHARTTGSLNSRLRRVRSTRNKKFCSSIAILGKTKFGRHRANQKTVIDIVTAFIVQVSTHDIRLPSVWSLMTKFRPYSDTTERLIQVAAEVGE